MATPDVDCTDGRTQRVSQIYKPQNKDIALRKCMQEQRKPLAKQSCACGFEAAFGLERLTSHGIECTVGHVSRSECSRVSGAVQCYTKPGDM